MHIEHCLVHFFKPGALNLLLLAYPQINMNPLWVPPNQNWPLCVPPKYLFFPYYRSYFEMIYISAYPLQTAFVPPGGRVPQVENRWLKPFQLFYYVCVWNVHSFVFRQKLEKKKKMISSEVFSTCEKVSFRKQTRTKFETNFFPIFSWNKDDYPNNVLLKLVAWISYLACYLEHE